MIVSVFAIMGTVLFVIVRAVREAEAHAAAAEGGAA